MSTKILDAQPASKTGDWVPLNSTGMQSLFPLRILGIGGYSGSEVIIEGSPNMTDVITLGTVGDDESLEVALPISFIRARTDGSLIGNATVYMEHS